MTVPLEREDEKGSPFYAPVVWENPAPSYDEYVLRENSSHAQKNGFDYEWWVDRRDFPEAHPEPANVDEVSDLVAKLTPLQAEVLFLHFRGHSKDQIAWMLDTSIKDVTKCIANASDLITAENLAQLGLLTAHRQNHISGRYARFLARTLGGLVDARIMRVLVEESHCGLQVMLANGQQVKLWLCSDETLELPGWAFMEDLEGEFLLAEEMTWLAGKVSSFVGNRRSATQAAREILSEIAQRAIDLLDELDGDDDLELSREDWEDESFEDQDEAPLTLQPAYQTVRILDRVIERDPGTAAPEERPECAKSPLDEDEQLRAYLKEIAILKDRKQRIECEVAAMPKHGVGFARIFFGDEMQVVLERLDQLRALVHEEAKLLD